MSPLPLHLHRHSQSEVPVVPGSVAASLIRKSTNELCPGNPLPYLNTKNRFTLFNGNDDGKQPSTNRSWEAKPGTLAEGRPNGRASTMMALLTKYNIFSKFITIHRIPDAAFV
jgi:hypothetical protein